MELNMIKNFEVLRVITESDGKIGVDFTAFQGNLTDDKHDGMEIMTGYLSLEANANIDAEIFAVIKDDWT
jgi:hypothetical protein